MSAKRKFSPREKDISHSLGEQINKEGIGHKPAGFLDNSAPQPITKPNSPLPNERYVLESHLLDYLDAHAGESMSLNEITRLVKNNAITLDPVSSNGDALSNLVLKHRGNMGIRAAAKEIGISPTTLSKIERGHIPDHKTLLTVCDWLGVICEFHYILPPTTDKESR